MARPQVIVLGTYNRKKRIEMEQLLAPLGIAVQTLEEMNEPSQVEETGETFLQNAELKACGYARQLQRWVIGEDSGLCVPWLGNQPGPRSARFAGPDATDEENNERLLAELAGATGDQRRAFYESTIVLSDPQGQPLITAVGRCCGRIVREPRGTAGFGYDPLFEIPEYHRTFAELGTVVKSAISHRARAMRSFLRKLQAIDSHLIEV